jgi:hypothetical protein
LELVDMSGIPRRYRVIAPYQTSYPDPIPFREGEQVKVGKEFSDDPDWQDWVWCEGEHGDCAWAPKQYLEIRADKGRFITDYNAQELNVLPGETLKIYEIVNGFGMAEKPDGARGWVPMRNLEREE